MIFDCISWYSKLSLWYSDRRGDCNVLGDFGQATSGWQRGNGGTEEHRQRGGIEPLYVSIPLELKSSPSTSSTHPSHWIYFFVWKCKNNNVGRKNRMTLWCHGCWSKLALSMPCCACGCSAPARQLICKDAIVQTGPCSQVKAVASWSIGTGWLLSKQNIVLLAVVGSRDWMQCSDFW